MRRKVSIIIPVHNAEVYLVECLYSVTTQTFQDMEIILIDDGSTDHSLEIIKTFKERDDRIIIITQPTCGLSAARNTGIRAASGEYILFIGSDDMIMPNSVETLYKKASETGSDLLLGNALWYTPNVPISVGFKRNEELNSQVGISGEECYLKLTKNNAFPLLISLFFMKRDLIIRNNLFFKKEIIYDELWCIQAMLIATRVTVIDFNYYYYRLIDDSLINSENRESRIKSLFIFAKEVKKLIQKSKKEKKSTELITCLNMKIFNLLHLINTLRWAIESYEQPFLDSRFFSQILREMYPKLSYEKQRECLNDYYFIDPIINRRVKK